MTNSVHPGRKSGEKGEQGTPAKALKQLPGKDYRLYRGSATAVFSRAILPAQPQTLIANIDSRQTISSLANIDCHPSDSPVTAKLKERWSHLAKASPSYANAIVQLDPSGQNHHTHDTPNQLGSPDDAGIVVREAVREIPFKGVTR